MGIVLPMTAKLRNYLPNDQKQTFGRYRLGAVASFAQIQQHLAQLFDDIGIAHALFQTSRAIDTLLFLFATRFETGQGIEVATEFFDVA